MPREIDRRTFLAGALTVSAATAMPRALRPTTTRPRTQAKGAEAAAASAAGEGTLVLLTLYGGNDGLNTVIPIGDSAYASQRGSVAIAPDKVLSLGNGFGLNPSLTALKAVWDAGQLAIVRGVSYPNASLSHFQSMDIWQSGSISEDVSSGWLGRWLDRTGNDVLQACSIGPTVLPAMAGDRRTAAALQDTTQPQGQLPQADARFLAYYHELQRPAPRVSALDNAAAQAGVNMLKVSKDAADAMRTEAPPTYSSDVGDVGTQLAIVSELIRAGSPTTAYAVNQGGYDTHSGELTTQNQNLAQLDGALSGFMASIAGSPRGRNTTVVIYSEFGRRVQPNASNGTDHGTASNVLVLGPTVHGGLYGEAPSITNLDDNGNLIYTTDYRSVYATVLEGVLNFESKAVLGKSYPTLGFV
ncbi:MAG TPA: DUF1501 domain-containing protein [Acidimicrobiales bacterium]